MCYAKQNIEVNFIMSPYIYVNNFRELPKFNFRNSIAYNHSNTLERDKDATRNFIVIHCSCWMSTSIVYYTCTQWRHKCRHQKHKVSEAHWIYYELILMTMFYYNFLCEKNSVLEFIERPSYVCVYICLCLCVCPFQSGWYTLSVSVSRQRQRERALSVSVSV